MHNLSGQAGPTQKVFQKRLGVTALTALLLAAQSPAQAAQMVCGSFFLSVGGASVPLALATLAQIPRPRLGFVTAALSADGQLVATVEPVHQGREEADVVLRDVRTGHELSRHRYVQVRSVFLVEDANRLVVVGTLPGDTKAHATAYSLTPGNQEGGTVLSIQENQTHGADVEQVVGLGGANWLVLRNSTNQISRVENPNWDPRNPGVRDRWLGVDNQGADLVDPVTGAVSRALRYGSLAPVRVDLNPRSSLAVLHLEDPVSNKTKRAVAIVDLRHPEQVLFQRDFPTSYRTSNGIQDFFHGTALEASWSADGTQLVILEKTTGSVIQWSAETRTVEREELREFRAAVPLAGGLALADGRVVLLRESGERRTGRLWEAVGHVVGREGRLASDGRPDFVLRLELAPMEFEFLRPGRTNFDSHFFEMRGGESWVFVIGRHLFAINARDPAHAVARASLGGELRGNSIVSIAKLDESTLRVVDGMSGVYDVRIP